ncbi:hypothetical protein Agub_g15334 [Astrephomene gubernaculifera]|uniref:Cytochrome b5 heme-binding domain-containing protein n=1 Tax=Astrephomene gubernaculifera TaxID=47775 RepID=A0AAD3E2W2_9CHLO|nr:hypothetical protein Agub_g15334 [Astrephomene gubernaculifera]
MEPTVKMDLPLMIATTVLAAVFIAFIILRQKFRYGKQLEQLTPKAKPRTFGVFTLEEVAKHDKPDDAWIIVQHLETKEYRVYDITTYIEEHPGGDAILRHVGGDTTEGFHGPQHPVTVYVLIEEYCVGKLAESEAAKLGK